MVGKKKKKNYDKNQIQTYSYIALFKPCHQIMKLDFIFICFYKKNQYCNEILFIGFAEIFFNADTEFLKFSHFNQNLFE